MSIISPAFKVLRAYLYLRRFEFHIVSVVTEYPLYRVILSTVPVEAQIP